MIQLLFFICGVAFAEWIIPVIDSIVSLFVTYVETKKGRCAVTIAKLQNTLENPPEKSPAIGFEWVSEEEGDEEVED